MEVNDASHAVSAIIAAGVMPAALEMMDREIIRAVEASIFAAGLPPDIGAALLIELDGIEAGIDVEAEKVRSICLEYGARSCRNARDEVERKQLWAARKGAFGAIGRISPDSMIQDAVVPRSRLPEVLGAAYDIAARYQLRIANVFHAGDGNLHPLICFDSRSADEVLRVREAGRELMQVCVAAGGTITGEHGVGLDKRDLLPLVFSDADMNAMLSVRAAFDPLELCNPGKIVPLLRGCGEAKAVAQPLDQSLVAPRPAVTNRPPRSSLAEIVGEDHVSSFDQSVLVSPGSIEELSEIVKLASLQGLSVMPVGGMTWLRGNADVLVSTARLNKIVEHEPADLIAIAQAGVKLSEFNARLSENGQWLPLDPPDDGRATLGGVVATGLGGAQQFGYGRPRGSVIGMKVVLADGSVIKMGGRVVKNVAGYDLSKLFTGSYGSLGLIAELNFKLRPRPVREATVAIDGPVSELLKIAGAIVAARLFPVAVEIVSPAFAALLDITADGPVLLVRFAGNEVGVKYQIEQTRALMNGGEVIADDNGLWRSVAAVPLQQPVGWRASVLPSKLTEVSKSIDVPGAIWQLGAADGRIIMLDNTVRNPVKEPEAPHFLMQRVKQQLDPSNLFNIRTT
jgi:FAD/FMN-containing dehydrogenase